MIVAIRKESNGTIYIDKEIYSRTTQVADKNGEIKTVQMFSEETLSKPPYNYNKVEVADIYADCVGADFNEDLTFSIEKYNARKQQESIVEYENKIVAEIRKKYNVNQELAILRQRDTKIQEYNEYYEYVEQCKAKVKSEIGG
jgi:hypothetical protein